MTCTDARRTASDLHRQPYWSTQSYAMLRSTTQCQTEQKPNGAALRRDEAPGLRSVQS